MKLLISRTSLECAWPLEGDGAETMACCAHVLPGKSYCPDHQKRAVVFTPPMRATGRRLAYLTGSGL